MQHSLVCRLDLEIVLSEVLNNTEVGFNEPVKALMTTFFGTPFVQPKRVQAVYMPAWIMDAEIEANIWTEDAPQVCCLQFAEWLYASLIM